MMSCKKVVLLIASTLFLSCTCVLSVQSKTPTVANVDYFLDSVQLNEFSIKGMSGNADSAERVMNYYIFVKREKKRSKFWAQIAAENGSPAAQFMLYQLTANSRNVDDQRRALFWLGMSANNGYFGADAVYKVCHSIEAKHNDVDSTPCFGPNAESVWPL